jgi:nitrite reductase/ring-hydroxylating ferredoxin subunit
MEENQMSWIEVAQVGQVPSAGMKSFPAGDSEILVINYDGGITLSTTNVRMPVETCQRGNWRG